jgi:hypothetical protein
VTREVLDYGLWPAVPQLFPTSFPGIKTGRNPLLVDIDHERLVRRMRQYFDPALSQAQLSQIAPHALATPGPAIRQRLLQRGFLAENVVRYSYRPFDLRWFYWEPEANLLAQKRLPYLRQPFKNNLWLELRRKAEAGFDRGYVVHTLSDSFGGRGSRFFPLYRALAEKQFSFFETDGATLHPNLSVKAMVYAKELNVTAPNLFYHTVAMLHAPAYRQENEAALSEDWPGIPLPAGKALLRQSALLGQKVVMLLNPEIRVPQVTTGPIRPDLEPVARLACRSDSAETPSPRPDLALTAGWSAAGRGPNPVPGPGRLVEREYTPAERAALERGGANSGLSLDQLDRYLGRTTYDIYLNETTYWANIPARVWQQTVSGYPVLKTWLSYRDQSRLGRPLRVDEVEAVGQIARRLTALILLGPALNRNYQAVKRAVYHWPY